ncbi:MAG TPA: hypothetical protein VGX28_02855 [Frankiaceae bacterium]|jgi:photosystem II stability/assembly factor-like uncharacterized protein|nr:hypothetical protein [Frankiaceae bacterium]
MADWQAFRDELESAPTRQPSFDVLRRRRRERVRRRAVAGALAVTLAGGATGVAILGEDRTAPRPLAAEAIPELNRIVNGKQVAPPKDYKDYVVTDVDFVSPVTGWALGLRCVGDACDVATWRTDDGGRTWSEPVPVAAGVPRASYADEDPAGGGVRSLRMVDGQTGYAFNPDLYVTHDGARTWRRIPRDSKVTSVSVSGDSVWFTHRGCPIAVDCDVVVETALTGDHVLHGLKVPETDGAPALVRRAGDDDAYLVTWDGASAPAAFWWTGDAGRTWRARRMPCPDATAVSMSARPERLLWLVCTTPAKRVAFASYDHGATWKAKPDPPAEGVVTDVVALNDREAYLTTQTPGAIHVYDDLEGWHKAEGTAPAYGYGNLDVVEENKLFAMGDAGELWVTEATDWTRLALPPGAPRAAATPPSAGGLGDPSVAWTGLSFVDARRGWAVGERCADGACRIELMETRDGGRAWYRTGAPERTAAAGTLSGDGEPTRWSVTFSDDRHGWITGPETFVTDDGGHRWRPDPGARSTGVVAHVTPHGDDVWAIGYRGCDDPPCDVRVLHGPREGHLIPVATPPLGEGPMDLAVADERHVYVLAQEKTVSTSDGGRTWTTSPLPACSVASVSAFGPTGLWATCTPSLAGDPQKQAYSTDGGRTWRVTDLPASGVAGHDIVAFSPTTAWRAGATRGVLLTRDGGLTWTGDPTVADAAWALTFVDARHGWLIAGNVLYRTTDGLTWQRLG